MVAIARKNTKPASVVEKSSPVKDKASNVKKDTATKKETSKKKVNLIEQYMRRFSKDTPGTLRFEAITKSGAVMQQADSEINQLYVRRSSPAMGNDPRFLRITVEVLDKLPGSTEDEE